jgi:formylglycine-generating enzyme required for sulfatase activity
MGKQPSSFSSRGRGNTLVKGMRTADFPVETVSFEDALALCARLNAARGTEPAGWVYRLPTESEWEHACRAGTTTAFHLGKSPSSTQLNCDGGQPFQGAGPGPSLERTCAVGSYPPNAFGLYDMHGNVWDWCSDWHAHYRAGPATDPQGPDSGSARVFRGGCWAARTSVCRSACRSQAQPSYRSDGVGIRIVLAPVS